MIFPNLMSDFPLRGPPLLLFTQCGGRSVHAIIRPPRDTLTLTRCIVDASYVIHIFVWFRTAYTVPSSRIFGRGELVIDSSKIASRYLRRHFWFDLLAALPLPQLLIWVVIPCLRGSNVIGAKQGLRVTIIFQFLLRLYLVFPLSSKIITTAGVVVEAAFNLMLFMLASHVIGSLWYLLSIERQEMCWKSVCDAQPNCHYLYFDCKTAVDSGRRSWFASSNITAMCGAATEFYDFGIYGDALNHGVSNSSFPNKYSYCLWWGLRNLSSLGPDKMLSEGIEPTRHTFNVLIWGFFLSGKVETANRFFEDMKTREITPDVVTYNTMINGYNPVGKMEEAEKYFLEMKGRNIEPTVITYATLIKGYVAVERVDDALRLVEEMKGYGIKPNVVTYSTLLPGLCDSEKMSEARSVLREMVEKHIPPTDNSIFMKLMLDQCKAGDLDAAVDVLKAMIKLSIPSEAGYYSVLIENCCKAGQYDRGVKLLDKLIEKDIILRPQSTLHMEPSAYNPMIEYLCSNGQTAKAETLVRQLMKLGVQDPMAMNALICGHSKEGTPDSAFELLKIMLRRKVASEKSAFDSLVQSYLTKKDPAEAKAVLDSMIENGHCPDSTLYRSVMDALFEDGRVQTASRLMKTMLEKAVADHEDLIFKILEALLMRGHVEEALGRIELLMQSGIAPDFDSLLSVLCEKGKTIAALKVLDYGMDRDYSCEKVLDTLLAAGKTLNAYSRLWRKEGLLIGAAAKT